MPEESFPPEIISIVDKWFEQFDYNPEFAEDIKLRELDPYVFDELMQDRLRDQELNVGYMMGDGEHHEEARRYWKWRFQPDNIPIDVREYSCSGEESLFVMEKGYEPEGMFLHVHPDETSEFRGTDIPKPELVFYGINESDGIAYVRTKAWSENNLSGDGDSPSGVRDFRL